MSERDRILVRIGAGLVIVALFLFALGQRYRIVSSNVNRPSAYLIDQWTGEVRFYDMYRWRSTEEGK